MSFKHVIGNIFPDSVVNSLRQIKSSLILRKEYNLQAKRFNRTFPANGPLALCKCKLESFF